MGVAAHGSRLEGGASQEGCRACARTSIVSAGKCQDRRPSHRFLKMKH